MRDHLKQLSQPLQVVAVVEVEVVVVVEAVGAVEALPLLFQPAFPPHMMRWQIHH